MPDDKKRKMWAIARYIVSILHVTQCGQVEMRNAIAMIARMFDVAVLIGPARDQLGKDLLYPGSPDKLLTYDPATRLIAPTTIVKAAAPWLPDIRAAPFEESGPMIVEIINNRFLHTKDLWLSWADGAGAADLHNTYGHDFPELLAPTCMHSAEEARLEFHNCGGCGAHTVCCAMTLGNFRGRDMRLCRKCLEPEEMLLPSSVTELHPASDRGPPGTGSGSGSGTSTGTGTGAGSTSGPGASGSAAPPKKHDSKAERARVKGLSRNNLRKEHEIVYPNKTESDKRNAEITEADERMQKEMRLSEESWHWRDAYLDSPITAYEGRLAASTDGVDPLTWRDGRAREHIAPNMVLTKAYANSIKGSHCPWNLKFLHMLDAAKSTEDEDKLVEYIDYLHIIRSQIPWKKKDRFNITYDESFAREFEHECRTATPLASACDKIKELDTEKFGPYLWRLSFRGSKTHRREEAELDQFDKVNKFLNDLESSADQKFRRLNGVPYPFKGGPDLPNWSWQTLYSLFGMNLDMIKRKCNSRHLTNYDRPRLICVMFYLLLHRRDAKPSMLLDVPVCVYTRHGLHYSVGKDDHAKEMSSGFAMDKEISFAGFDISQCNLCVEPWSCNVARGNQDEENDAIRNDFRQHLKRHNPPHWNEDLPPLVPAISEQFIQKASAAVGDFDDGYQGDGDGDGDNEPGGGFDPPTPTVPERRNMKNLAETCYMSTVLQTLHNNKDFRNFIANPANFLFKAETGTDDSVYLPFDVNKNDLEDADTAAYRVQRLASQRLLMNSLRKLSAKLDQGGNRLSARDTEDILARIRAIDLHWGNKSNESAELLNLILENVVLASDTSASTTMNSSRYPREEAIVGEIVHYGIYKRREAPPATEPAGAAAETEHGHTQRDEDERFVPRPDTPTGDIQPGPRDPTKDPALPDPPAHVRITRERPTSSDADTSGERHVELRRELTGDVAAARHEQSISAREAAVQLHESDLTRRENDLQLWEEEMRRRFEALSMNEHDARVLHDKAQEHDRVQSQIQGIRRQRETWDEQITKWKDWIASVEKQAQSELDEIAAQRASVVENIGALHREIAGLDVQVGELDNRRQQLSDQLASNRAWAEREIQVLRDMMLDLLK